MMRHKNCDDALINSAYLSELWAVKDLERFKASYPQLWTQEREYQLQEEKAHAKMCLHALKQRSEFIEYDLRFAMQETLYRRLKGLHLEDTHSEIDFDAVQYLMEKRAVWIYKVYSLSGQVDQYKSVFLSILNDERGHLKIDQDVEFQSTTFFKKIYALDRELFRKDLLRKFPNVIFNPEFWGFYYSRGVSQSKMTQAQAAPLGL